MSMRVTSLGHGTIIPFLQLRLRDMLIYVQENFQHCSFKPHVGDGMVIIPYSGIDFAAIQIKISVLWF